MRDGVRAAAAGNTDMARRINGDDDAPQRCAMPTDAPSLGGILPVRSWAGRASARQHRTATIARRLGAGVAGALFMYTGVVGCTSGDRADRSDTPSSRVSTPALSAPSPDARTVALDGAVLAYRGMWQAYVQAAETADPTHPALKKYATGTALQVLTQAVSGLRANGQVAKGQPTLHPRVLRSTGDPLSSVEIQDCADSTTSLIYDKKSGKLDDTPGGRRAIGATVIDTIDGWKVSLFGVREVGSC